VAEEEALWRKLLGRAWAARDVRRRIALEKIFREIAR
jgi:hypothetical protein